MKEAIDYFGAAPRLFGIRTPPVPVARSTAVVMANSGIVHRIGANRTTVLLARHLAAVGYETLRFDFSGLGDSPNRADQMSFENSSPLELNSAVDFMCDRRGASGIVLYGNCGGAAKSFWAAQVNHRVKGLVLTNPPPHPADPEFGGEVEAYAHGNIVSDAHSVDVGPALVQLLDRGVQALFVYTAGDIGESYFHARLANRVMPYLENGRLTIASIYRTNHTLASEASRARLLRIASDWLVANFPDRV